MFETVVGNTLLLGAVGPLQFEIVAHRLATRVQGRRDLRRREHLDGALAHLSRRERRGATSSASSAASLATDVDGNPVFLAPNKYNLQVTMERWPKVGFHATREHGERRPDDASCRSAPVDGVSFQAAGGSTVRVGLVTPGGGGVFGGG